MRVVLRSVSVMRRHEWAFLGLLGLLGLILGFIGFLRLEDTRSGWDAFYRDLQLLVLEGGHLGGQAVPWEIEVARLLLPLVAAYAGLKGLAAIFREQAGLLRIRFLPPRVVVCGLGERGHIIVRALRERGQRVAVIEKERTNELIESCQRMGAVVMTGDATDPEVLHASRVGRARHLVTVCGDDRTNAEIAVLARGPACRPRPATRSRRRRSWWAVGRWWPGALTCTVHIVDPRLCELLKAHEIEAAPDDGFRLDCFNLYEAAAHAVLRDHPPFGGSGEEKSPHVLVIGLGRLGQSVLVQAARRWAAERGPAGDRPKVTVIDRRAGAVVAALSSRFPRLQRVCEVNSLDIEVGSPEFDRADFLFDGEGRCDLTRVYVCLGDESVALTAALRLHQDLRGRGIPILVRTARAAGLASLLQRGQGSATELDTLQAFGLLDEVGDADLLLGGTYEVLARATHQEYVRSQMAAGQTPETNHALVPWEELPETLKESNRDQAAHIGSKLRQIGCGIVPWSDWDAESFTFTPEEIELLSESEHERWMAERLRNGWTYGVGTKDVEKKESPYLVPWAELTEEVREWDRVAVRGMPAFLAQVGLQVVRLSPRGTAHEAD